MKNRFMTATEHRPQGERTLNADMVSIDLPFFIAEIKSEKKWKHTVRNAITIFKSDKMRMVLIALQKNAEPIKHKANGVINIHVLEGHIDVVTDDKTFSLSKSKMLAVHQGLAHNVIAKEESIFLLTVIMF